MDTAVLNLPQGIPQPQSNTYQTYDDDVEYHPIERLRRQYTDFLGAKDQEIKEAREARHYYHGDQWTADEINALKRRKQPVVTSNRIVRKIDAIVGLVERLRQDPKAYPRTPQHDEGADLASAVLRYVLDRNDWKSKSSRIARSAAIDGVAGIEYDLQAGDDGDPDLSLHIVYGDTFFYDPRSFDEGFTDGRYVGIAKWIDIEQAKEMFPDKAEEIDGLIETGSDLTTSADMDREKIWINSNEKRVRLVDHWYIKGGQWLWTIYIGNTVMMQGVSPFKDEDGKTFPRYRCFSAAVDHDGDRYGFVRNLKSPQDEVNHRRSKALHLLNNKLTVSEKGAVDDVELARRERARPDGWIELNPGLKIEFPDTKQDFAGQLEMLQEAKNEIENFGPNPALIGQGLEDSSGRAISLLQQAGIAELGPYLSAFKNWKIRVYRDIWNIVQAHWKSERWIRVTDDQNLAQFFQINKLTIDQFGHPAIVNAVGSLDVDIIIDEGPDAVNLQADAYMVLQSLGPAFAQQFPEIALELAPIPNSVKKPMLDELKQKQSQPPPPDPKVMAQVQIAKSKAQIDAQGDQMQAQAKAQEEAGYRELEWRKAQLSALTSIEVARIGAKTDADSSILGAKLEAALGFAQMVHEKQEAAQDRAHEQNLAAQQQASQPQENVGA